MDKYPRTYHLPFSPEVHNDDKIIYNHCLKNFIGTEVVITEKLDGQNQTFKGHSGVYARSHAVETQLPWDTYVKQYYYNNLHLIDPNVWYIFENMFAIHSIDYEKLDHYIHMFATYFEDIEMWGSWDEVEQYAKSINVPYTPVLFRGIFKNIQEIEKWMNIYIKEPSAYGSEREGFVIRITDRIPAKDFSFYMAKYVRKGHIQTDEHWTKNWKRAVLSK